MQNRDSRAEPPGEPWSGARSLAAALDAERQLAARLESLIGVTRLPPDADEATVAQLLIRQLATALGARAGFVAIELDGRFHALGSVDAEPILALLEGRDVASFHAWPRFLAGEGVVLRPYIEGDVSESALSASRAAGFTAYAAFPLEIDGRLAGVTAMFFDRPVDELALDDRTLEAIGRSISIVFDNLRLRDRLTVSEQRYRTLFEQSPDALVVESLEGLLVDANPAAARLFRQDREALIGVHVDELAAADDGTAAEQRAAAIRSGRATFSGQGRRPDGTTFPQEVELTRIDVGAEARLLALVRDVTERQHLQSELLQAQKMEAIGQLVAGVAHELNNPLAAIIAFSQLIRRDPRLPDDMRSDADLLTQEADRTRRIVQNLLDFARQRPPERHPTSIRTLVESVLSLQSYSIGTSQITVDLDIPPDLPAVSIDRAQMQQVVLNLTLNAIQAIRASKTSGRIEITARAVDGGAGEGSYLRLSIVDDGPGVPPGLRSRLFIPFFTTKEPGGGTGLGLSVSFGIVAGHGGRLSYEPGPGGTGAAFIVELPIEPTDGGEHAAARLPPKRTNVPAPAPLGAAGAPTTAAPVGAPAPPPRVLVLDDEPAIRTFLARVLRHVGYDGVITSEGAEAIEHARSGDFAAILCDHRMAGMSGIDVYEAIVALRPELAPRFVFMSGDVLNPDLRSFAEEHDVALLAKPFDIETVQRTVRQIVEATQRG